MAGVGDVDWLSRVVVGYRIHAEVVRGIWDCCEAAGTVLRCKIGAAMMVREGLPLAATRGQQFWEWEWLSGAVVGLLRVAGGREGDWLPCVLENSQQVVERGGGGGAVERMEWNWYELP